MARLGAHIALEQKAFSKSIPSLASRSIVGVGLSLASLLPYAPTACEVWSSDIIKRILGRFALTKSLAQKRTNKTISAEIFILHLVFREF